MMLQSNSMMSPSFQLSSLKMLKIGQIMSMFQQMPSSRISTFGNDYSLYLLYSCTAQLNLNHFSLKYMDFEWFGFNFTHARTKKLSSESFFSETQKKNYSPLNSHFKRNTINKPKSMSKVPKSKSSPALNHKKLKLYMGPRLWTSH